MRTTPFRSLFVATTFLVLVVAAVLPGRFANTAQAGPLTAPAAVTDCNECTDKIVSLTLRHEGTTAKRIIVQTKDAQTVYFDGIVQPGQTFSFTGTGKDNTFASNDLEFILLDQNSTFNPNASDFGQDSDVNVIQFHVSCSKPVQTGMDTAQQDEWANGDENDAVSNDPDKGKLFVAGATQKDGVTLCAPPTSSNEAFCYLIADNDNFKSGSADGLTFLDGSFNEFFIGMTGTPNTEALAFVPETGILYGGDANELVTINVLTGAATVVGTFGSGSGQFGTISFSDVDGLTWDPFQDIMYATSRRSGEDVLFQVNLATGKAIKNAFGPGVDYVGVDKINNLDDIDDIAISTVDGKMYAIQNESGQDSRLILINKTDGTTTDIGDLDVPNVEGLGFHPDGRLLGITGDATRSVVEISLNPFSSNTTLIENLGVNGFGDYEGIACLTEPDNTIMGSVLVDPKLIDLELVKTASVQETQALDTIEYTITLTNNTSDLANSPQANSGVAAAGVTVQLYRDNGVAGTYEPGTDVFVASTVTAANGSYGFDVSATGDFIVRVDLSTVPNLAVNPSDNVEAVSFAGFGGSSANHDFHFTTFTTATGISVKDTFPANATFVSASTASGSFNSGTMVWSPANLAPGASATLTINATSTATSTVENCAEVMTANQPDVDSVPGNGNANEDDQDCHSYDPPRDPGTPDVKVEKTASNTEADLGDTIAYTLTATNMGAAQATGVVLTDALPYGVSFVSANPNAGVVYDANSHTITWTVGTLAGGASTQITVNVLVDWMTGTFSGSFLQDGFYRLINHPVHGQAPPPYGLRLDQLYAGTGPITFNFDHPQSDMRMRIENGGSTVTIFGTTWGGIDTGAAYSQDGLWEVYMQYDGTVAPAGGDNDLQVTVETDNGTITPLYTTAFFNAGDAYALTGKSDGNYTFRLGDEDDDLGFRSTPGISGWGWLSHDGPGDMGYYSASDWGFMATPAPDELENCLTVQALDQTDANPNNNTSCFTTVTPPVDDPGLNFITGTVYLDLDQDGIRDGGEPGQDNVTVTVYRDLNSNGQVDGGDTVFSSTVTPAHGFYAVLVPETGAFVVTTDFPGSYPAGAALTTDNVETASFANYWNIDSGNDFGFFAAQQGPDIDLSLDKTADVNAVQVGGFITYTLTLTNSAQAAQAATGIEIWDTFPHTLIEIQSTAPAAGVVFNNNNGTLKWTIPSLAPGASTQLTILAEATAAGNAVNCAQVGAATGNDPDSTPGNGNVNEDDYDCHPVEITVNGPVTGSIGDLVFQDQNNNGQWDPGEPGLGGVLVRLYAGACGPNGTPIALRTTQANGSYLFTGLPAGDYCVDVRDDTVPFGYVLSTGNDPMTVTLAQGEVYDDADFGYYYDPQLTTVDLELVKEVDTSSPALNDNVTFTITIRNQGPGTATGVIVRDIIPVGLVFVESSSTQGSYEATKLGYWTIGTLEPGQTETLTITTTVVITNMIENIAQVVAVDQPDIDSTPGNGIPSEDDQDNALVESRGPGAAGDITRAECADIGTINAILYEPNHNIVLAGSEVGSVHISNDQGLNWPVFMQSNGGAAIQDIVATPNGSAIYVGTFGDGVWRSTDGGENWSKYKLGTNTVNDLDLDLNNNRLYAAVDKNVMFIDLGTGTTGTVPGDPFNDQVLSLVYDENTNRLIAASAGAGAWKYEAGTWTDVSAGLPIGKINTMLQTPAGAVLAGTNSDGVYVFGGGGWFQYGMGLDSEPIESLGLGGNGEILAGARESGAYYFNQVSFEWESIGNLPIFTVASMTAGAQGEVYAGAPGEGIYVIYDTDFDGIPDQAHQVANFMTSAVIQDMVVAPNGDIYAASYGYGVLYSSDGGNCWTRMNRGLENLWTFGIARTSDGTLFIGIWADGLGGIWRSTNNGRDWEFLAYGDRQIISLAVDPNNEDIIYAGANLAGEGSIVRSMDGGDTWHQLQSFIQPVWAIQIDPNNSNRVVVGTLGDGIYESMDQGATWNQIGAVANGLADPNGFDLKFGPTGRLFAATNAGVYVYDDQGGFPTYTWSLYGNGSEAYQMRTIEFVGSDIFAGTWNAGLVFYDSGTGDWTDLGLADIPVIAFAVHQATETLVIGTSGSGVYLNHNIRASFATDTEDAPTGNELPSAFSLDQNYPNPFNPQTTIPFGLTESGPVRIAVYDVLGREVSMLVDRVMEPGQHRITWEAGELPTGNYLVRMEAGGKVFTRSMVLMK
jgi:uncharacterized repeat protein (TIGR01451 family)